MMMTRIFRWIDRACLPLMGALSAVVALLNYHAEHNFHTIDKHLVFRERILHGFAITDVPSYPIPPTFPMWGYGWVLLLTTSKPVLIGLQIVAALGAVWCLLRALDAIGLLDPLSRALLRVLLIGCTPWYAYNSIEWSQSLATSCLVASVALLIRAPRADETSRWRLLALSAVGFGLNLNFASDLYLLPLFLAAAYFWYAGPSRAVAAQMLAWLAVVVLTLVPWMLYSWRAVGTPLVKSTNQGHVLLAGLGQDALQRFGTTYSDGDPLMYRILEEQLGHERASRFYASCSYEADLVLRRAFLQIIARQPRDYLDLVTWKMKQMLTGAIGTYSGEFDEGGNVGAFGVGLRIRTRLRRVTQETGHGMQLGTAVLAPVALWAAVWLRRRAWALLLAPIAYQYISCSLAALQPQYVSNVILFQLVVCAGGAGTLMSGVRSGFSRLP